MMITMSWLVLHAGCVDGGSRWRRAATQLILQFSDPGGHDGPCLVSAQPLVLPIVCQGLLRTFEISVIQDAQIEMSGGVVGVERQRFAVSVLGARVISIFSVENAEPAVGKSILGVGGDGGGETVERLLALVAARIEHAEIGQRARILRVILGQGSECRARVVRFVVLHHSRAAWNRCSASLFGAACD